MGDKQIPPEVIDKLVSDLKQFEPGADVEGPARVRITADRARIFPQPTATRKDFRTVGKGSEFAFIGRRGAFVGLAYEDAPYWTSTHNVELLGPPDVGLVAPASKPPTATVSKAGAPAFRDYALTKRRKVVLTANVELPVLGAFRDSVLLERDDKPFWTHRDNLDIDPSILASYAVTGGAAAAKGKGGGFLADWRDTLVRKAVELRNQYASNDYISIKGFSIEIGVPPSLSIDFEFRS
jgi:hypothetical protein